MYMKNNPAPPKMYININESLSESNLSFMDVVILFIKNMQIKTIFQYPYIVIQKELLQR